MKTYTVRVTRTGIATVQATTKAEARRKIEQDDHLNSIQGRANIRWAPVSCHISSLEERA